MRISDWSSDVCSSDLEQQLTRLHAPEFIFHILRASLKNLDQVPAKLGLYGLTDLIGLKRIHGPLECGYGFTRRQPAKIDRKSVGEGKSVSVRGDLGGCRLIKKKKNNKYKSKEH